MILPSTLAAGGRLKAWHLRRISLDRHLNRHFVHAAVAPTFSMMMCVFGLPLLFSIYLSFTGWNLDQPLFAGRFVGLLNYDDLLKST